MDWHRLRQQGCLTIALTLAAGVLLSIALPGEMELRTALLLIALLALCIGWVP